MSRVNMIFLTFVSIIFGCWLPYAESIKISPCAKWNKSGIVVAGNGGTEPEAIFIHKKTNILYVADLGNERIQMFSLNKLPAMGTTVIFNIPYPTKIYVDDDINGQTIYVSLEGEHCVKKWTQGATHGVKVGGECLYCSSVWVDKEKNVYMASAAKHCVFKWSPRTNITTTVAGREYYAGSTSDNLNSPEGIYFDETSGTVYVADYANNRIQKWLKNAPNGTTVAGLSTSAAGSDAESLSRPTAVWVDDDTHVVYVADSSNERIQRWLYNAPMGDTIAGGLGDGDKQGQLDQPNDLAFDNNGNLYVSDRLNHRVLMFKIIHNDPCFPTSTGY
ncbi:unnamed protein product [Rotaria socialis]|uniref:Uncharacterized protein n=1 Tax=Rotaria socialis TaxID=392032 RepID=A0A818RI57_9BILA|nr:unnamed protein product [Rotaria socialis]